MSRLKRVPAVFLRVFLMAFLMALALPGPDALAQAPETFKARLSAVPADARTRAELAGLGTVTATLAGTKLTLSGTFEGLRSAATTATLYNAVAAGVRGTAIGEVTVAKGVDGKLSGSFDLTPPQLANLHKGGLYVQIQSVKAPDGVLWGWLMK